MTQMRIEKDSMGTIEVPQNALYSAQTQRAINNFPISNMPLPVSFIRSLIHIKSSAAKANAQLNLLPENMGAAIVKACRVLLDDVHLMKHFPVDVFQTGSGTSTNMNANEVIANLANTLNLTEHEVHPNDHVNCCQSSNDVIPSSIHVSSALALEQNLLPALRHIIDVIHNKANSVGDICKTGRTHLMDAMPVRLAQCLNGWAAMFNQHILHLEALLASFHKLAIGGTAVGTGINAHPDFAAYLCDELQKETGISFAPANDYFAAISSQDTAVTLSGLNKAIAVTLMKVSNDLRWMNSGPLAGLGEIALPALQPGSSIMPGKVNPVIPEATAMVAAQVIGNDTAITIGAQSGNFELNVMLPMIAYNLLSSISLLTNSLHLLADKAIAGFSVKHNNLQAALHKNPILVTALNPVIGYAKAAEIAKKAYTEQRPIIDVAQEMTNISREELTKLLDPLKLTQGGL